MATYADSAFKFRVPVAVPVFVTGAGSGGATQHVEIQIPPDWDLFWQNIKSNFFDIQLFVPEGSTQIVYQRKTGASFSGRNLTLQFSHFFDDQDSTHLIYLYFGDSAASTDPTSSVAMPATPLSGTVWIGRPVRIVRPSLNNNGRSVPETVLTKQDGETIDIWFDVRRLLAAYIDSFNGRLGYEGISKVKPKSLDENGADSTSRYLKMNSYFLNGYASIRVTGGTSGTDYSTGLDISTTNGQTLEVRCLLKIQNLLPS